jgi:hypothetical protein
MFKLHEGQFAISIYVRFLNYLLADLSDLFRGKLITGEKTQTLFQVLSSNMVVLIKVWIKSWLISSFTISIL